MQAQNLGLVISIGTSNYDKTELEVLKNAGLPTPAVNQVCCVMWPCVLWVELYNPSGANATYFSGGDVDPGLR